MTRKWTRSTRVLAVGGAVALLAATAPVAAAQIQPLQLPGVDSTTEVFPVDNTDVQIEVDSPDLENGTVGVSLTNNTEEDLTCTGIDDAAAGTVTTAPLVAQAVDFYAQHPHGELADLTIDFIGAADSLADDIPIDLGSAVGMLPGSVAEMVNSEWAARAAIGEGFEQARLDGQFGETATSFDIPADEGTELTIELAHTSQGEREDFQAGFFMTCELDGQRYVFHGFDGDAPLTPGGGSGSLGSAGLGS